MSEDILHRLRSTNQNPAIQFPPKVYEALVSIEDIHVCLAIANKARYNWECLLRIDLQTTFSIVICNENRTLMPTNWVHLFKRIFRNWFPNNAYCMIELCMQLQAKAEDCISLMHQEAQAKLFSFHLFWQPYIHKIKLHWQSHRLELQQLFLDSGRTAHSALKLPLNMQITETSTKILEWVKYSNHVNSLYGTNVLIAQNYINHQWLNAHAILATKTTMSMPSTSAFKTKYQAKRQHISPSIL